MRQVAYTNSLISVTIPINTITDHFEPVEILGMELPCYYLKITNTAFFDNYRVYISFDGIEIHDYILPNDYLEIDTNFNRPHPISCLWKEGQVIYAMSPDYPYAKPALGFLTLNGYSFYDYREV